MDFLGHLHAGLYKDVSALKDGNLKKYVCILHPSLAAGEGPNCGVLPPTYPLPCKRGRRESGRGRSAK